MTTGALWAFSLDFYARPGVSAACIALQDDSGADADVVLFALWCARRGCTLDNAGLDTVDAAVAPWRAAVVQPARAARRALKPPPSGLFDPAAVEALRQRLLAAEVEAERLQQGVMEAMAPPPGADDPAGAARHNLSAVARLFAISPADPALPVLLDAFA